MMKMPGKVRMAGILVATFVVLMVAVSTIVSTDILSGFATGSERLAPGDTPAGKALVAYNPGLSGATKDAAMRIAADMQSRGYEVELAGIRSAAAANLSGYDIIIAGGPIYGGKVSSSVQSYLKGLNPPANTTVGAFAAGSIFKDMVIQPFPDSVALKATVLLFRGDDADLECAGFVDALLKSGV